MNMIYARVSCVLALSALLSGCAFSTDKIDLSYNARGAREKVAGAEGVKVQVTAIDKRAIRDKVGRKINGFGAEHGAIESTTDVVELVRGAIETELSLRGFPKGDSALVTCDVNEFWNRFKTGFWSGDSIASINLTVQVKNREGKVLFSKNVVAEGLEPNIQVAAGHNAQPALEQGLSKAIENLFQEPDFIPSLFKAAGVAQ
ncbi:MAG TPA: YajG family lipoprotein [Verrucomicrobiae bacterium]